MAIGVLNVLYSEYTRQEQIGDQKEIDRLNAANLKAETAEAAKRIESANIRTTKLLRAQEAASGFAVGGSTSARVGAIIKEQQQDLDWMKTAGASRLDIMRQESAARLRLMKAEKTAALFQGISGAYSTYRTEHGTSTAK